MSLMKIFLQVAKSGTKPNLKDQWVFEFTRRGPKLFSYKFEFKQESEPHEDPCYAYVELTNSMKSDKYSKKLSIEQQKIQINKNR